MIQRNLTLELTDIYGGDGIERPETFEEIVMEEQEKTITVRKELGVPIEREHETRKVREREESVRTFKRNDDGQPMYRLGGTHGKLWGVMKEAAESMYDTGEIELSLTAIRERFMPSVQVRPQWCVLEMPEDVEMELDVLPQMLEGRGNRMVEFYFDVIPEATTEVTVRHPETYDPVVDKIIVRSQVMSFGNKRRGTLTVADEQKREVELTA